MANKPRIPLSVITFLLSCLAYLALRLWNIQNSLYFIYDQGRDAVKLAELLRGQITLIGPTTGISGLFLGPLWYYINVPGFLLTHGNPMGLAIWAIFLSALVLPFVWWLGEKFF